ncbi:CD209 antigen-like protein 2 [Megalobrama amblycephala]|uniref:CD209 antigen-like protein 2 n=1 Tax=Megalobrama amblycephala TaxID=75352 RepID=UPI002014376E|nr:CD209 antigen-like protein 2 [Megalobrama amblycephala]
MDLEDFYENDEPRDIKTTAGPRTLNHSWDEGKDQKLRGSRCLVLMTVCLGIICVLLLVFIILQQISNTEERESLFKSYKNAVEEFNQTINSLQGNYTELMKKLKLETELRKLYEQGSGRFLISAEQMNWTDSRQYCRDRGADLVIIKTEEKQRCISSFVKGRMWIGLTDIENEKIMKWVDNSTLKQGFWFKGEPNNDGNEDCIELDPEKDPVNNWNDLPCSEKRKGICEN